MGVWKLLILLVCVAPLLTQGVSRSSVDRSAPTVIGILSQPINVPQDKQSHIVASYARWLEASGSRVVPIFYNSTLGELDQVFSQINGLLYAGGADIIDHTWYYNASLYLFRRAIKANEAGDYFPVWGTCLGFELMSMITAAGDFSILSRFDAENISLPLKFSNQAPSSRLFGNCPSNIYSTLQGRSMTANAHHYGLAPETFSKTPLLPQFYRLLATSFDRKNNEFVAAVEAIKYPFYATQFHPEGSLFYWGPSTDHGPEAIEAMQYLSRFFVNECRKNTHGFPSPDVLNRALIDQYCPRFEGEESVYLFK